jgi:chromosome segregation ATPase
MDLEFAVQKLRSVTRESTITESDVNVFKERLKEISTTVMSALDRMNRFEMEMNSKLSKTEDLSKSFERIEALKSVTNDVREQVRIMRDVQASVQDLYGKIMTIYDSGKLGWDKIQNVARDVSEIEKVRTDIGDLRKIVEWLVSKSENRLI